MHLDVRQDSTQIGVYDCKGVEWPTVACAMSLNVRVMRIAIVYTVPSPLSGPLIKGEAGNRIDIKVITTDPSLSR